VFYRDLASGPFYGFNRPGAKSSEAIIQNWWRQGMMGRAKAHYDGIVASGIAGYWRMWQWIRLALVTSSMRWRRSA